MSRSKGEEKIAQILRANHISFKQEVSFPDLKSYKGKPLRFDFGLFRNGKLFALVEYDGESHFKQVSKYQKTVFDFYEAQERDRRKNSYCLARGIPLIRVPYWDLSNLTLERLLTNPSYQVKSKFHSDLLMRR